MGALRPDVCQKLLPRCLSAVLTFSLDLPLLSLFLTFSPSKFCPPCHPENALVPLPSASFLTSPQLGQHPPSECLEEDAKTTKRRKKRKSSKLSLATKRKRKKNTKTLRSMTTKKKETKKTEENGEEEDDKDEEEAEDEAPEDDADEQEQEEDEPAVKTKVVKGSESKTTATEAETEHLDDED